MILGTEKKWQKDKKPVEEIAKVTLGTFCALNPNFINCNNCTMSKLYLCYWELMCAMLIKVLEERTSKFITMCVNSLKGDLKKIILNTRTCLAIKETPLIGIELMIELQKMKLCRDRDNCLLIKRKDDWKCYSFQD